MTVLDDERNDRASASPKENLGYGLIAVTVLLWSMIEVISKMIQSDLPPMTIAFLRFFIGGLCLLPFQVGFGHGSLAADGADQCFPGNGEQGSSTLAVFCCRGSAGYACVLARSRALASWFAASGVAAAAGAACTSSGGTLATRHEAANMLFAQEKIEKSTGVPGVLSHWAERCHRTKMNKQEIRELISPAPVYPGVEDLCDVAVRRV